MQPPNSLLSENGTVEPRLLSQRDVIRITGLSRTTLWRLRADGQFPEPVQISPGRKAFFSDDIAAWLDSKKGEVCL